MSNEIFEQLYNGKNGPLPFAPRTPAPPTLPPILPMNEAPKIKDSNEHIQCEELNDNCFVYASKQLGLTESDLSIMRQRMFIRYQTPKHLNTLCQELNIKIIIHDLDDVNIIDR